MEILLLLIGVILGGVISWLLIHIYYVKGKGLEKLSQNIWSSSSKIMVRQSLPEFFADNVKILRGKLEINENKCTPYIYELRVIVEDTIVKCLARVVDEGWNHSSNDIEVSINKEQCKIEYIGFGFDFVKLNSNQCLIDPIEIEFFLKDLSGNKKTQLFKIKR